MAQYLSPEWFTEMEHAVEAYTFEGEPGRAVRLREQVKDTPFGDVSYVLSIEDGTLTLMRHSEADVDVTFTQDYATAAALHRAEITTQEAFFAGKVRVSGHLNTLLDNADLLQGVAPLFDAIRANTTY